MTDEDIATLKWELNYYKDELAERDEALRADIDHLHDENDRLRAERDRLLAIVAKLCHRYEWWEASAEDPHPVWECFEGSICSGCNGGTDLVRSEPMDPADAELIRHAINVGGDR